MNLRTVAILFVCVALTVVGDYFVKLASRDAGGLMTARFALGAVLYGIPAVGWFFLMRDHSLAAAAVLYSAATLVGMAALGLVAFGEGLSWAKATAVGLALASVALIGLDDA